jgi:hypothetical protein
VNLLAFTCPLGSAPNIPTQQADALALATIRQFVPNGDKWAQGVLAANAKGVHRRTYRGILVTLGIGAIEVQGEGLHPTLTLGIQATGYVFTGA